MTTVKATRPSWTPGETEALHAIRAQLAGIGVTVGTAPTPAERTVLPTEGIPDGVHLKSILILVPPAADIPSSILDGYITPSGVPGFYPSILPIDSLSLRSTSVAVFFIHDGGGVAGHPTDAVHLRSGQAVEGYHSVRPIVSPGHSTRGHVPCDSVGRRRCHACALVAVAPAADFTHSLTPFARAQADILPIEAYDACVKDLLHEADSPFVTTTPFVSSIWKRIEPLVSTAHAAFPTEGWPRILILVGTADQLVDLSRTVAEKLRASGLGAFEVMAHGFWILPVFIKAKEKVQQKVVEFMRA